MSRSDLARIADIYAAIAAIHAHLERGDLSDGLVFDAVRVRLIEIGEAVKGLPSNLRDQQPEIPWDKIAGMRDHLTHRYFDTSHAILQGTVDHDLPSLVTALDWIASGLQDPNEVAAEVARNRLRKEDDW